MATYLRDYQLSAQEQCFEAWKTYRRLMLQLPTGGGKTALVCQLIKHFIERGQRCMFIAHREELITQAWATFHRHGIMSGVVKSDVKPAAHFLSQVGSIQTMIRRKSLPPADVIFIDEAHHAMDDNSYGTVLKEQYPKALVLGVTATPYRLNGKGFIKQFDELIETIQIGALIDRGFLVPFRYFVGSSPDLTDIKMKSGDYDQKETAEAMKVVPLVESYIEHAKGKSGMVFAVNVDHSRQIVTDYIAAGFSAAHIDANTPAEDRRRIIAKFKNKEILILSNVGIATEGFDVPNMDFVQLARPTKSLSLFLQMVGRASRVDNETIKAANSDEERKFNIECSSKPCAIILDNASLYLDHGMPWHDQEWRKWFNGVNKKEKKPWSEFIEIIEFIAEDSKGNRFSTGIPSEIEGLKLIEIKHILQERVENLGSLKELDREIAVLQNIPRIDKVGYVAYKNYRAYCRRNKILISPPIWDGITSRLADEPIKVIKREAGDLERVIKALRASYPFDEETYSRLKIVANKIYAERVAPVERLKVSHFFLQKEQSEYLTLDKFNVEAAQ